MSLPITMLPTETLHEPSRELSQDEILSPKFQTLITEMIPAMYDNDGIGLAAPQVGVNVRLCIIGKNAVDKDERPPATPKQTTQKDLVLIKKTDRKLLKFPGLWNGQFLRTLHSMIAKLN